MCSEAAFLGRSASHTRTVRLILPRAIAAPNPAGPPPTIRTSKSDRIPAPNCFPTSTPSDLLFYMCSR
jgi:hypothetical protein